MISYLVGFVLALVGVYAQTPLGELEKKWEVALAGVTVREDLAVAFDINLNFAPPLGLEKLTGRDLIAFLAGASGRFHSEVDGIHVFARSSGSGGLATGSRDERSVDWLRRASEDHLKLMASSGMDFEELMGVFGADVAALVMPGDDRNVEILENPEASRLFVNVWIQVDITDPKTGRQLSSMIASAHPAEVKESGEPGAKPRIMTALPTMPQEGTYRIEKPRLMAAGEFIKGASEAFRTPYAYDRRLAAMPIVVRGNFTQERFEQVTKKLFETVALTPQPAELRVERQIDALLAGEPWQKLVRDEFTGGVMPVLALEAIARRSVSGSLLLDARPGYEQTFDRLGVAPGQVQVKLKPVLAFTVRTPTARDGSRDFVIIVR